jgi:hypothetical protein
MASQETKSKRAPSYIDKPTISNLFRNLRNPIILKRQIDWEHLLGMYHFPLHHFKNGPYASAEKIPLMEPRFKKKGSGAVKVPRNTLSDLKDRKQELEKRIKHRRLSEKLKKGGKPEEVETIEKEIESLGLSKQDLRADNVLANALAVLHILNLNPSKQNKENASKVIQLIASYYLNKKEGYSQADTGQHLAIAPKIPPFSQELTEHLATSGFSLPEVMYLLTGYKESSFYNRSNRHTFWKKVLRIGEKTTVKGGLSLATALIIYQAFIANPQAFEHPVLTSIITLVVSLLANKLNDRIIDGYHLNEDKAIVGHINAKLNDLPLANGLFGEFEEQTNLATELALEKTAYYGGALHKMIPAIADIFERHFSSQPGNGVFLNKFFGDNRPGVLFLKQTRVIDDSNFTIQTVSQLESINPAVDQDVNMQNFLRSILPHQYPKSNNRKLDSLSDILRKLVYLDFARTYTKKYAKGKSPIPNPENFHEYIARIGEDKNILVKMFSEEKPELAILLALPLTQRVASMFQFGFGPLHESLSALRDNLNFGFQGDNKGNTGILGRGLVEYFDRLYNAFTQSYVNRIMSKMKNSIENAEYAYLLGRLPESALSQPLNQVFETIAFFALDHTAEGKTGSTKQLMRAMINGMEKKIDQPANLLLTISALSSLQAYIKMAGELRDLFGYPKEIINHSIKNMEETEKQIVNGIFQHFIRDKATLIAGNPEESDQFTMFCIWIAKENPKLLNENAKYLDLLFAQSGARSEGYPPSLRFFFVLFFVAKALKNVDAPYSYDIDSEITDPFYQSIVKHFTNHANDLINFNLGQRKPIKELTEWDMRVVHEAAKVIEIAAAIVPKKTVNHFAEQLLIEAEEELDGFPMMFNNVERFKAGDQYKYDLMRMHRLRDTIKALEPKVTTEKLKTGLNEMSKRISEAFVKAGEQMPNVEISNP